MKKQVAVGYIRCSTEEQVKEGVSMSAQNQKIIDYCNCHDIELLTVFEDAGVSGKSMQNRAGLQSCLEVLREGRAEILICYQLSRLSRSTRDVLDLCAQFKEEKISLHSISEKLVTGTAQGMFFLTLIASLSEMERAMTIERTIFALTHKKNSGEWVGRIPFGFQVAENGCLIEEPEEQKTISKVKRLRRKGKTIREIAKSVNRSSGLVYSLINEHGKSRKSKYLKVSA